MTIKLLLVAIALFIAPFISYSQVNPFWHELLQPEMGVVNKIYQDYTGNIYLSTPNGLFISKDDGNSWNKLNIYASNDLLAINSKDLLFTQTTEHYTIHRLLMSSDNGNIWIIAKDTMPDAACLLSFDSSDVLYFIDRNTDNKITTRISSDYGLTWQINEFKHNLPTKYTNWYNVISKNGVLYSGGYYVQNGEYKGALFISKNRGKTWDCNLDVPDIKCIELINQDTLFIGAKGGLFLTTNGGKDWERRLVDDYILDVTLLKQNELIVSYNNKCHYSSDLGYTWDSVYVSNSYKHNFCVDRQKRYIFAGSSRGFFITSGIKSQWRKSNKGFTAANIAEMAEDSNGNLYAVGHPDGVYKSADNGLSWNYSGLERQYLANIAINRNNDIFVSRGAYSSNDGVLYRSTDNGMTWEDKSKDLIWSSGISVSIEDIFITRQGNILLGTEFEKYWISTDNGESWSERKVEGDAHCFTYNSEGHLFRGGYDGIFYRSTDEGQTWEKMKKVVNQKSYEFYSMVFSPYSQVGFASGYSAIWNYSEPSCLKTTDNGRSWFNSDYCGCLAVDSLGNFWNNAFISTNNGDSWEPKTSGLLHSPNSIFVSHDGYLFLCAENGGLYRSRDRYVSVPETQEPPGSKDRLSASPNPASDYIEISGISPPAMGWGEDRIRIYNALGECVLSVETQCINYVETQCIASLQRIDISPLPPGLYFVRIGEIVFKFVKL